MPRKFLIPLLTAIFLAVPAFAPVTMMNLSSSAVAASTIKSSKSNTSDRHHFVGHHLNSSNRRLKPGATSYGTARMKQTGQNSGPVDLPNPLFGLNIHKAKPVK
jgi:hypothetical protein